MTIVFYRSAPLSLKFCLAIVVGTSNVLAADGLVARVERAVIEVGEPIVLDLVLRLENPLRTASNDPRQVTEEATRLKHHLVAELWNDTGRVATAFIGGTRFLGEDGATEAMASIVGWFGNEEPAKPRSRFTFWPVPGDYHVMVKSEDGGLKASEFMLKIVPPRVPAATDGLVRDGLDALALLLLQHEYGASAVPAFESISREFPDTIPGQYARAALALREGIWSRRGLVQHSVVDAELLDTDLQKAAESFRQGHPYRTHALYERAWLLAGNGQTELAVEVARQVIKEARTADAKEGAQNLAGAVLRRTDDQTGLER